MNKKNLFLIGFLLILGVSIYFFLQRGDIEVPEIEIPSETVVESNFSLESKYVGENSWEYTILGELPNPCYSTDVEEIVMESFPEQVRVVLTLIEPDPDTMCAQVIEPYEYSGVFQASEDAKITLEVQ